MKTRKLDVLTTDLFEAEKVKDFSELDKTIREFIIQYAPTIPYISRSDGNINETYLIDKNSTIEYAHNKGDVFTVRVDRGLKKSVFATVTFNMPNTPDYLNLHQIFKEETSKHMVESPFSEPVKVEETKVPFYYRILQNIGILG